MDYKKADMFLRREMGFRFPNTKSPFEILHEIIKKADPDLSGSEIVRKSYAKWYREEDINKKKS